MKCYAIIQEWWNKQPNICCAFCLTTKGGVQRHGAVDKLERSGYEEGGRKPSWWDGDEEMGVLSLCFGNGECAVKNITVRFCSLNDDCGCFFSLLKNSELKRIGWRLCCCFDRVVLLQKTAASVQCLKTWLLSLVWQSGVCVCVCVFWKWPSGMMVK